MNVSKTTRRVLSSVVLTVIACGCVSPGWTLYTYNSSPAAVLVRFASSDGDVIRLVGPDQQGFVFVGVSRPNGASVEFLDPLTCASLATIVDAPTQHAEVDFEPGNIVQVGVDDPGTQPRDLLPTSQACQ